jgi:hypothetical protein
LNGPIENVGHNEGCNDCICRSNVELHG